MTPRRGRLPQTAEDCTELAELFGCLLTAGHTLEEALLFLLQITDEDADAEMRITTVVA